MAPKRTEAEPQPGGTTPEAGQPLPLKKRRRALKTLENVRGLVAHVLRELEANAMDPKRAGAMLFGAQVLSKLIGETDLERRLSALERRRREAEPCQPQAH